jgi:hypothetical protein
LVERLISPYLGLDVADSGLLDEAYGGHPAGTPYVVVRAACGMDREHAHRLLEPIAGLPQLAWECGWEAALNASGDYCTQLRLFPQANN